MSVLDCLKSKAVVGTVCKFSLHSVIEDLGGGSMGLLVSLDMSLQPTNPAHRLTAVINEGIFSKVSRQKNITFAAFAQRTAQLRD